MNEILQRVSYLRGLADGLKIDDQKNEGKLLLETINVLEEIAFALDEIDFRQELFAEDLGDISENVIDIESYIYDLDMEGLDFDDFDFDDLDERYSDYIDEFDDDDEDYDEEYTFEDEEEKE